MWLFPRLWLVIHRVAALVRQWALWVLNPAPWHSVQQVDVSSTERCGWDFCSCWIQQTLNDWNRAAEAQTLAFTWFLFCKAKWDHNSLTIPTTSMLRQNWAQRIAGSWLGSFQCIWIRTLRHSIKYELLTHLSSPTGCEDIFSPVIWINIPKNTRDDQSTFQCHLHREELVFNLMVGQKRQVLTTTGCLCLDLINARVERSKHTGHKIMRQVSEVWPERGPALKYIRVEYYILNCALWPRVVVFWVDTAVKG